jgi:hypothetical protein
MAYIAPNSTILICRDVPLSPDYIHTVDFENSTLQSAYFLTKAKFNLEKYSYQRKNGILTVALTTEQLYDCNYIAYKNTSFENKWFYGFITNIEYVSNDVTNIYFSEDVLQTWMFDYTLNPCFVVREHTLNDKIGANIEPEGLELGPYGVGDRYFFDCGSQDELCFIVAAGVIVRYNVVDGTRVEYVVEKSDEGQYITSGAYVYNGLFLNVIKPVTLSNNYTYKAAQITAGAMEAIDNAGYHDSIVSVTAAPLKFINNYDKEGMSTFSWKITKPYASVSGYVPKNKKLFTSPYIFLNVQNDDGTEANYEYEFFEMDKATFRLDYALQINGSVQLRAERYKGSPFQTQPITVTNYPVCSYSTDTFKTWYAQNQVRYKTNLVKAGIEGAMSIAGAMLGQNYTNKRGELNRAYAKRRREVANIDISESSAAANTAYTAANAVTNIAELVLDNMAEEQIHQINNITGTYSGDDETNCTFGYKGFTANAMSITAAYAQRIDMYFSMFGYKTNYTKVPNTKGRFSWNYVKTVGCDAQGSIPQYAIEAINAIFNTGITIWHNAAWVGDYTRDNRITGNG